MPEKEVFILWGNGITADLQTPAHTVIDQVLLLIAIDVLYSTGQLLSFSVCSTRIGRLYL
jgi:hypothetical protein